MSANMTSRRDFLTRFALLTSAALVLDPAELIERLAPRKLYVPGADFGNRIFRLGKLSQRSAFSMPWDKEALASIYDRFAVQVVSGRGMIDASPERAYLNERWGTA